MTALSPAARAVALLAVAILAAAIALALTQRHHHRSLPRGSGLWYSALAAPYLPSGGAKRSACNVTIGPRTKGVAHPTLPCGVKVYIEYGRKQVLTQVIDRGPDVPGREFDVTTALAKELGLVGTREIRWRYTTAGS